MRIIPVIALLAAALLGCDNAISPYAEGAEEVFALHGFLDTAADTQWVRVAPMAFAGAEELNFEGVSVKSRELDTGAEQIWTHRQEVVTEDGSRMYFAVFRPQPDRRYEISVGRSDQRRVRTVTHVPPVPTIEIGALQGTATYRIQNVRILGRSTAPHDIDIVYRVRADGSPEIYPVTVEYGPVGNGTEQAWITGIHLDRDEDLFFRLDEIPDGARIALVEVLVRTAILSDEWPFPRPPVEQGHGFVGSVGRYDIPVRIPHELVLLVGWDDEQEVLKVGG